MKLGMPRPVTFLQVQKAKAPSAITPMPMKPMIAGGDKPPERNACCMGEGGDDVGDVDDEGEDEGVEPGLVPSARGNSGYGVGRREPDEEDMADASGQVAEGGQLTLCAQRARE